MREDLVKAIETANLRKFMALCESIIDTESIFLGRDEFWKK